MKRNGAIDLWSGCCEVLGSVDSVRLIRNDGSRFIAAGTDTPAASLHAVVLHGYGWSAGLRLNEHRIDDPCPPAFPYALHMISFLLRLMASFSVVAS